MPSGRPLLALAFAIATALSFASANAVGQPASSDSKLAASKHFRAGVAAYKLHSYVEAAENFEKAYALAPHATALWNAADAREKAGEVAKAANMYARYLDIAPEDDKDRVETRGRISSLTTRLGRLDIAAGNATNIAVDDEPVGQNPFFVDPGDHVVTGVINGGKVSRKVNVVAGSKARVRLEGGAAAATAAADPAEPGAGAAEPGKPEDAAKPIKPPPAADDKSTGPGPEYFYIAAGVSAVLAGATIWSGLNTQSQKKDFDANPTHQGYLDGVSAQKRTNILLGVTAAASVATVAIGVFVVKWGDDKEKEATVSLTPGGAKLRMEF